jgi:predicted dehydrogenase
MKFGIVGLGSMGRRRVRDLLALGHEVVGYDERADRLEAGVSEFELEPANGFAELLAAEPAALVISTPPDQHVAYFDLAAAAGLPFFCEANVLTPPRSSLGAARAYPSATWRFYTPLCTLRAALGGGDSGRVLSAHHYYGGYLPLWHPWEEYDAFYAGRTRETSAAREMVPFELEWLTWILGPVEAVTAEHGSLATWRTEIDDTYLLLLEFASGARGTLAVELHQVARIREARFSCQEHGYVLDFAEHELRRRGAADDDWTILENRPVDFEAVYRSEIASFAAAIAGNGEYPKTWEEERHLSDVLVASEASAAQGARRVRVRDVVDSYDGRSLRIGGTTGG